MLALHQLYIASNMTCGLHTQVHSAHYNQFMPALRRAAWPLTTCWAVWHPTPYLGDVQGHVQGADDATVAIRQAVLDVVERGVHQHPVVVPGRRLDADGFVHLAQKKQSSGHQPRCTTKLTAALERDT